MWPGRLEGILILIETHLGPKRPENLAVANWFEATGL